MDSVGLFSVMWYVLYLKHDALAQQLHVCLFHVPFKVLTECNVNGMVPGTVSEVTCA